MGKNKKFTLARAVLKDSPIILLDDVTKSIDVDSREAINEVINSLKNKKTIIIVTHSAHEIHEEGHVVYLKK